MVVVLVVDFAFAEVEDVGRSDDSDFNDEQFVVEVDELGDITATNFLYVPLREAFVAD
jgi:hypothetical protein